MRFNQIIKQVSGSESLKLGRETKRYWSIGSIWMDVIGIHYYLHIHDLILQSALVSAAVTSNDCRMCNGFITIVLHTNRALFCKKILINFLKFIGWSWRKLNSARSILFARAILSCLNKTINAYNSLPNCRIVNKEKANICTKVPIIRQPFQRFYFSNMVFG